MDGYGVETALLAYAGINRRVAWWDPERWALVFREADARVFVRRLPRFAALIAARRDPRDVRVLAAGRDRDAAARPRPAASPVPDCEWQRRLGDLMFDLDGTPSTRDAGRLRSRAGGAGRLPARRRRGAPLRLAGRVALGAGAPADALPLLDRALARGDVRADDAGEPRRRAGGARPRRRRGGGVDRGDRARRRFGAVGAGARAPRPAAPTVAVRRQASDVGDVGHWPDAYSRSPTNDVLSCERPAAVWRSTTTSREPSDRRRS